MELRLYTFINFYLSSIQQGIQSAHLVHDIMLKYAPHSSGDAKMVNDWARDWKTIIVLNGGTADDLLETRQLFDSQGQYPHTHFRESVDCLEGVMTGVGVVLPEFVFGCERAEPDAIGVPTFKRPSGELVTFSHPDWKIIEHLKRKGLAR